MSVWNTWPSWGESKQLPDKILHKIFKAANIVWCGWRYQDCIVGIQNNSVNERGREKYLDLIVLMSNLYIFTSVSQWNEIISKSMHNRLAGIVLKVFFINYLDYLNWLKTQSYKRFEWHFKIWHPCFKYDETDIFILLSSYEYSGKLNL